MFKRLGIVAGTLLTLYGAAQAFISIESLYERKAIAVEREKRAEVRFDKLDKSITCNALLNRFALVDDTIHRLESSGQNKGEYYAVKLRERETIDKQLTTSGCAR